ncbi:MAG: hypothetical protein ACKVG2_06390 [Candidatus Poseidoniales archaeon]|jgi:hypothetical protein|tara:strand:- start:518 stop:2176 length:1659 start_codon:yes stop_codon:yes gene_type:complete
MNRGRPWIFLCTLALSLLVVGEALAADSDGDGYEDTSDLFPNDDQQWNDTDGDGFGDNPVMPNGDGCIDTAYSSNQGCPLAAESTDKVQGEVGTYTFSLTLLFSIILGVFLGIKSGGLFSSVEEDDTEYFEEEQTEYQYGILALLLIIVMLLSTASSTTQLLAEQDIVFNSDDNGWVWISGATENSELYLDDIDEDGHNDVFYADYDVEFGGDGTAEVEAMINVTGPDFRTEQMVQIRNITGTDSELDTNFTVYPWVEGAYSITIWVNVVGNVVEGNSDGGTFGGSVADFDTGPMLEPTLELEGDDEVIEGEECEVEVVLSDPLHDSWNSTTQYFESGLEWLYPDSIESGIMLLNCSSFSIGNYQLQAEYTSDFGQEDAAVHWLNVTAAENEPEPVDVSMTITVDQANGCMVSVTTPDPQNITSIGLEGHSNPQYGTGNPYWDCSQWDSKVYHYTAISVGVNGESDSENLTIIIADPIILAMAEGSVANDEINALSLKQALTYLAGLSIALTLGVTLVVAFIHTRMSNQRSHRGSMKSGMQEFKDKSNRRER